MPSYCVAISTVEEMDGRAREVELHSVPHFPQLYKGSATHWPTRTLPRMRSALRIGY